jgi:hypothetical protein
MKNQNQIDPVDLADNYPIIGNLENRKILTSIKVPAKVKNVEKAI